MLPFPSRPRAPWAKPSGLEALLEAWRADPRIAPRLALDERLPAEEARWAPLPERLAPEVAAALASRGIRRLYAHQKEAFERSVLGEDLVVATPTASGKSLCYHLPVLDALARSPDARALYLFPTKALARDQEESLSALLRAAGLGHGALTYDGDTPGDARRVAKERSGVVLTNPDMLHAGILPHHAGWARFFANLRYVVVDELHAYRGAFGSHLAHVLRRLERVAAFHGARPQLVFASATIANPAEHASHLSGRTVTLVRGSGAPRAERHLLVYDPPIVNAELGLRRSYVKCAVDLTVDLLRAGVSAIVFGQSRSTVEVMLKYLRDRIAPEELAPGCIKAYRGGYLPETRRRIERGLRDGDVRCVVATNALELGIDIGALDAVVCAGYPGTMAALHQRFGRGGRRGRSSLAVLVPSSSPLDQYIARTPELVLSAPVEAARIDPDNVDILLSHLKCAAFELPFRSQGLTYGDVPADVLEDALGFFSAHGIVRRVSGRGQVTWHWSAQAHPATEIPLRAPSYDNFVIIEVESERVLAEMDYRSTHTQLHEQAIYQHDGQQFQVERLDHKNHKAYVRRVAPDFYTTAMTHVRVSVLEEEEAKPLDGFFESPAAPGDGAPAAASGPLWAGLGEVLIVEQVVGFKKIRFHTHENVGYGEVDLPPLEKPTTAFWITVPDRVILLAGAPRAAVMDALRGWLRALEGVAAVGLMMDPRDIGSAFVDEPAVGPEQSGGDRRFEPTLYLYDAVAGGVGLAPRLWEDRRALLLRSARLVDRCPCSDGCPSCVGPVAGEGAGRRPLLRRLLSQFGLSPEAGC